MQECILSCIKNANLSQQIAWFVLFHDQILFFKKNFMAPFLWMGFSCLKDMEPLRGDSLLFTTKFPEIPGTHFNNLKRMKGWVDLEGTP